MKHLSKWLIDIENNPVKHFALNWELFLIFRPPQLLHIGEWRYSVPNKLATCMDYKSLMQPTWCRKKWHINTKKISNKCAIFKKSKSSCDIWATRGGGGGGWRRVEGNMQMDQHDKSECWMKTYSININSDLIPVACSGWRSFRYDNIPELHFTSHLHHHGELHTLYSACLICDGHVHATHCTHTHPPPPPPPPPFSLQACWQTQLSAASLVN